MESVLFRFSIVWLVLHIILFFIEWYRYKKSNLSWRYFRNVKMLEITKFTLFLDGMCLIISIVGLIMYWIFQPLLK